MTNAEKALATIACAVVMSVPSSGQQLQDPSPVLPPDYLGAQLIVWSQAQKPQRVPQPLPDSGSPQDAGVSQEPSAVGSKGYPQDEKVTQPAQRRHESDDRL